MIEERLTNDERQILVALAVVQLQNVRERSQLYTEDIPKLRSALAKLSGVDTVVVVHRAYPSRP
jgi:hypothetical protein